VDLIRSGKVPAAIRRNGAEGNLPLPLEDKIEVLVILAGSSDPELSRKAFDTLCAWNLNEICTVIADGRTSAEVLQFAAERLAALHENFRPILLANPSLPVESRIRLEQMTGQQSKSPNAAAEFQPDAAAEPPAEPVHVTEQEAVEILAKLAAGAEIEEVIGAVEAPPEVTMRDDQLTSRDRETLIQKIGRMTVVEKIKAALTGNMETRAMLIRDSNKIISRAVLQSPKISETEAENYAAAKNVSEEVLRLISTNRKFMRSYAIMRALVNNPRAPIDVTLPLMVRINEKDLKGLTLNRNVPEVIRSLAFKLVKQKEDAGKSKIFTRNK
jgi:hypothetical protein